MKTVTRNRARPVAWPVAVTLAVSVALGGGLVVGAAACGDPSMLLQAVCLGLVVGGVSGTFLASAGVRAGWLLLLGMQPMWIAYSVVTGQYGFVVGSVAYAGAQINGYLHAPIRRGVMQGESGNGEARGSGSVPDCPTE